MTVVKFVSHNETDVLLWMTAESPAGPFDTTQKLWRAAIDKLAAQGYVEALVDGNWNEVRVTPAGEARAKELRAAGETP